MDVVVGIDIGTSNMKFLAATRGGRTIKLISKKMQIDRPRPGWSEFNILTLKQNLLTGLEELKDSLPNGTKIASIGIDSIGESIVGLSEENEIITPCPTWYDRRTEHSIREFGVDNETWYNKTGMVDDDIYTIYRINWFRKRYPEDVKHISKWLCVADYAVYLLTGHQITTPSLACRTGFLDRSKLNWNTDFLEMAHVKETYLPELVSQCSISVPSNEYTERTTGIAKGTPVVHAGHDHACATFGCTISKPGLIIDSSGTAEAVNTLVTEPMSYEKSMKGSYDCYPFVLPGLYAFSGHLPQSGGLFEWAGRLVTGTRHDSYLTIGHMEELFTEASESPVGSKGVRIVPFLEGSGSPWHQRNQSASIHGLKSHHTRGDVIRAVFESTAYWLRWNVNVISKLLGGEFLSVIASGGGAKTQLWLEIKSAMLKRPFKLPHIGESAALGAALVAGLSTEFFASVEEAMELPDVSWSEFDAGTQKYEEYEDLAHELHSLFARELEQHRGD